MKTLLQIIILYVVTLLLATTTFAAEPAKTEAPKEGDVPAEGAPKSSSAQEVLDLQSKLQGLKTKIIMKRDTIRKLIEEKQKVKEEKKAIEIVNNLKTEHKDLQIAVKDYEEQRSLLNYRYPEKGLPGGRVYERIELKSLDEMESEFSIEGKVKRTVGRLRQQYPSTSKSMQKQAETAAEQKQTVVPVNDPSRSSVTEPQVLSK